MLSNISSGNDKLPDRYAGYILLNDIYLAEFNNTDSATTGQFINLGILSKIFLGNDNTLYDLNVVSSADDTGLFSTIESGKIGNLSIYGASNESSTKYTGLLAGRMTSGMLTDIFVTNADIVATGMYTGGLIGRVSIRNLSSSISTISMLSENDETIQGKENVGGLFGYIQGYSTTYRLVVSNVTITGYDIVSTEAEESESLEIYDNKGYDYESGYIGGVAGETKYVVFQNTTNTSTNVNATNKKLGNVGGIVGAISYGEIQLAHNTGNVYGVGNIGGIAGRAANTDFVGSSVNPIESQGVVGWTSNYATKNIGGVVGFFRNSTMIYARSFNASVYGGNVVGGVLGYVLTDNMTYSAVIQYVNAVSTTIYYRSINDIDGDNGQRSSIQIGQNDTSDILNSFADTGSRLYLGFGGYYETYSTDALYRYDTNQSFEIGGLDSRFWSVLNTTYNISFGYIYGSLYFTIADILKVGWQVTGDTYSNTKVTDLYDEFTTYGYLYNEDNSDYPGWGKKDTLAFKISVTRKKRVLDMQTDVSAFAYGGKTITKENITTDNSRNLAYVEYTNNPNIRSPYVEDGQYGFIFEGFLNYVC